MKFIESKSIYVHKQNFKNYMQKYIENMDCSFRSVHVQDIGG